MKIEHEALGVASTVVHTAAANISGFHGYGRGAANRWLQLHDAKARPADTAVPLRVWPLYSAAPFGEALPDEIKCANGVVFVVSTTEATLTYDAATVVDIFVTGDSSFDTTGTSVAGDYVTPDEILVVWANNAGPKRLVRIESTDIDNVGPAYLQVHASSSPTDASLVASFLVPLSDSIDQFFGDGLYVSKNIAGSLTQGCTMAFSTTKNTYTPTGSDTIPIKATYRS